MGLLLFFTLRTSPMIPSLVRRLLLLLCCLCLAACGFHLRGPQPLPFSTIYLEMNPYSDMTVMIKRQIALSGSTTVVDKADAAQVRLVVVRDAKEKHIQSISGSGTVSEYELRQRFAFRLIDKQGHEAMPFNEIYVFRSMSFSTGLELSKEQEENQLYADMQKDIVEQLVRRLATAKL